MDTMMPMTTHSNAMLAPMEEFYSAMDKPLPEAHWMTGEAMPQPARSLLVHVDDMTPALEAYHGHTLTLRLIDRHERERTLSRMVILETIEGGIPVEFGMIRIHLERFDEDARREILRCRTPLGTILHHWRMSHTCHPCGYFAVCSDAVINEAFGLDRSTRLFGRCNLLRDERGEVLAEVVEILPPMKYGNPGDSPEHEAS